MKKKICVVTGSRADYGLLQNLIKKFHFDKYINLKILATGMHLSNDFGNTYKEIIKDGFKIEKKIKILSRFDKPHDISKSTGKGIKLFSSIFKFLKPDLIVVLGDRFEIFSSVVAANFHRIPVAHIGGGELTLGAFDDVLRHSMSKMSWFHFVSTSESKKRIIQLGEDPKRIFITGSVGIDRLRNTKLLNKNSIEKKMNFKFNKKNLLITYHPVTLENNTSALQFKQILLAVSKLTYPNSDTHGKVIIKMIEKFVSLKKNESIKFKSMGHINYLSVLKQVDCIIGNSSSGIVEAPSLKTFTINIGQRQEGRLKAKSVIDTKPIKENILQSIKKIYSIDYKKKLSKLKNPYEIKNSSNKIFNTIKKSIIPFELKKKFYDL